MQDFSLEQETYVIIGKWLEQYHSASDKSRKAKTKALIVTRMLPIIKKIAKAIARRSYDPIDDLVQAGSIGLLKAIESYSSDINDNFNIYAGYLIIGEMKHYLRDKLNAIKVPRYIQELSYRINVFTSTLTLDELNKLTSDDVAEALNVSTSEINYVVQAERRKSMISLDDIYSGGTDNLSYEEVLTNEEYSENIDLADAKIILTELIDKLPDSCKHIIELYYYKDMNQNEIAKELNITKMMVSRKLKKAFSILYKMIAEKKDEEEND